VKPGDLVHFVDCKETQYDTLGLIIGFMPKLHRDDSHGNNPGGLSEWGLFKVEWYDDPSCGIEDYDKEDLEKVSEGWRLS
jgi:hypothetical protein